MIKIDWDHDVEEKWWNTDGKVNTSPTGYRLTHIPTGVAVTGDVQLGARLDAQMALHRAIFDHEFDTKEKRMKFIHDIIFQAEHSANDVPLLIHFLNDSDENVVQGAADALGHMGPLAQGAWMRIVDLLNDTNRPTSTRDTCAYALGQFKCFNKYVVRSLVDAMYKSKGTVHDRAVDALWFITRDIYSKVART